MNVYQVTLIAEATPEQFAGHFLQFPTGERLAYAIKCEDSSGERAEGLAVLADVAQFVRQPGDVLVGGIRIGRVKVEAMPLYVANRLDHAAKMRQLAAAA